MAVRSICGVILVSDDVEALVAFYRQALEIEFEREDHGDLAVHFGADLGQVHFGIHPRQNFGGHGPSRATPIAFAVSALDDHLPRCRELGATVVIEPHDEGFGPVVTLADPQGNLFELVELSYEFDPGPSPAG